jgi:hypothetical protein
MRFDTASATPRLTFKAVRPLEADELELTQAKGQSAEAKAAIASTAAQADGVTKASVPDRAPEFERPAQEATKAQPKVEAEAVEESAEPTKRAKKAAPKDVADILDDWAE